MKNDIGYVLNLLNQMERQSGNTLINCHKCELKVTAFKCTVKVIINKTVSCGTIRPATQDTSRLPYINRCFCHPLLCWMPRRLWRYKFDCPSCRRELVSAGPYENVREVLGLTSYYYAVTEELQCKGCKKRLLSWNKPILDQLDVAHRSQFPVLLTYK